jgi:hypothetical protein
MRVRAGRLLAEAGKLAVSQRPVPPWSAPPQLGATSDSTVCTQRCGRPRGTCRCPRSRREPHHRRAPAGQLQLPCSASLTGGTGWAAPAPAVARRAALAVGRPAVRLGRAHALGSLLGCARCCRAWAALTPRTRACTAPG